VFERDWQTSGDGLLTFDDVNKREWLDLSQTLLVQFPGVSIEAKYQSVLSELGPGGMFEGFTSAKSDDVVAFVQSAGLDTTTRDFNTNSIAALNLIESLGATGINSVGRRESRGFVDEIEPSRLQLRFEAIIDHFPPHPSYVGGAGLLIAAGNDLQSPSSVTGVMLFRAAIPEPSTLVLFSVLAVKLGLMRLSRSARSATNKLSLTR
jgi:hypothetical protein